MQHTAVFWIRDGVLIDRMPVNAVAFAVAAARFADSPIELASLINFAFETSGISCLDKLRKYNNEHGAVIRDVNGAADRYALVATDAAAHCEYFPGTIELVRNLHSSGVHQFITSAVDQSVLDAWADSAQGHVLKPFLTEILGKRGDSFQKGKDHFAYAAEKYAVKRILYVADARAEIVSGSQYSSEFGITPIGFASVITREKIRSAHKLVMDAHLEKPCEPANRVSLELDENALFLPDQQALIGELKDAGAHIVCTGSFGQITFELSKTLQETGLLTEAFST